MIPNFPQDHSMAHRSQCDITWGHCCWGHRGQGWPGGPGTRQSWRPSSSWWRSRCLTRSGPRSSSDTRSRWHSGTLTACLASQWLSTPRPTNSRRITSIRGWKTFLRLSSLRVLTAKPCLKLFSLCWNLRFVPVLIINKTDNCSSLVGGRRHLAGGNEQELARNNVQGVRVWQIRKTCSNSLGTGVILIFLYLVSYYISPLHQDWWPKEGAYTFAGGEKAFRAGGGNQRTRGEETGGCGGRKQWNEIKVFHWREFCLGPKCLEKIFENESVDIRHRMKTYSCWVYSIRFYCDTSIE